MPSTTVTLSPERRRLINLIRQIHFGRIENLVIRSGEPVLGPEMTIVRDVLLSMPPKKATPDVVSLSELKLKKSTLNLLKQLDNLVRAHIKTIEVRDGQPAFLRIEQPFSAFVEEDENDTVIRA